MMPAALQRLAEMRLQGFVPADRIWLLVGDYPQIEWWKWSDSAPEVVVPENIQVSRLDLRPIVGLHVFVQAERYSAELMTLCERARLYAAKLDVFVMSWLPNDVGFRWDREHELISPMLEIEKGGMQ